MNVETHSRKRKKTVIDLSLDAEDEEKVPATSSSLVASLSSHTSGTTVRKWAWLRHELRTQMDMLYRNQPDLYCFGPITGYERQSKRTKNGSTRSIYLRFPLEDNSKLNSNSWYKVIDAQIIARLGNNPTNRDMCWLIRLPSFQLDSAQATSRLKKKDRKDPYAGGAKVNVMLGSNDYTSTWKLHRVVHAMYNPHVFAIVGEFDVPDNIHLAHRCGNGVRGFPWDEGRDNVCVNPFHVRYLKETQNYDEKFCRNGCFDMCPHYDLARPDVRCLWTWRDTGEVKICRSRPRDGQPMICNCTRNCYQPARLQEPHLDQTFAEVFPRATIESKREKDSDE